MVIDTSAVIAMLLKKPETLDFADAIHAAERVSMSAANLLEAGIDVDRRGGRISNATLERLLGAIDVAIVPVIVPQVHLARAAYQRFGKGRYRAGLNFGDCFAYALAKERNGPLLFTGNDFSLTDMLPALA